jgi:glutathione S-transferase
VTTRTLALDDFWVSPYAMYAFVALREKGLPFATRNVALQRGEQRTPAYLAASGTGKVPLLEDDGFALTESLAIIDYLEDAYAFPSYPRLLPADARERARARQLLDWLGSDFSALRSTRPTSTVFYDRPVEPLTSEAAAEVERLVTFLRPRLVGGATRLFDAWSIADAAAAMMLMRAAKSADPLPAYARRYAEAQWERPSVRAFVTAPRPAFEAY